MIPFLYGCSGVFGCSEVEQNEQLNRGTVERFEQGGVFLREIVGEEHRQRRKWVIGIHEVGVLEKEVTKCAEKLLQ